MAKQPNKKITKSERRYREILRQRRKVAKKKVVKRAPYVDTVIHLIGYQDCRIVVDGVTVRDGDAAHGSLIIGSPYEK